MTALTVNALPWFVREPNPSIYQTGVPLFLDFETTNLDKGSARNKMNKIVLACWQEGWDGEIQHKWGGEFALSDLLAAISRCDFIVAHNAKFELHWLARCGGFLEEMLVYDTMLAEYVIGGNRWKTQQLSLEKCCRRRGLPSKGQVVSRMMKAGTPTQDIPKEWLLKYCQQDVRLLPLLMKRQLSDLTSGLLPVVYSRCLLTPALADIERNGIALTSQPILKLADELEAELAQWERKANLLAEGVNLNSPKQMAAFLYDQLKFAEPTVRRGRSVVPDRTPAGGRKTDADTIAGLVCTTAQQREFKEVFTKAREIGGQLTMYLRKFKQCIEEANGVLYADFNQMQTATQRLSSSGSTYRVQFQNQPRAYKRFFRAKKAGYLVGETDGAQIEFRAAGHLGRDSAIRADVLAGVDVHSFTSRTLTEAGQETDRQNAKEHTFKPLYGGQSGTDAERAYYQAFREKYPGITETQSRWVDTVLQHKKLVTEWGLTYYWPDTRMDSRGYISNTTSICNYPVQALATAEIVPLALVCMWHRLKRSKHDIELVNTVHDSLVAELHPDEQETFNELAKQCMIYDAERMVRLLYGMELYVPLGCGVKIGDVWGSGTEKKYEKEHEAE